MTDLVRPLPRAARFVLRGGPDVMHAAGAALGLSISNVACRASTRGAWAALWLGPDEQLLLAPEHAEPEILSLLSQALSNLPHSLVNVSHRQSALELSGPQARIALSAGCPLDLDARVFPVGSCTRTLLGKAEVILWYAQEDIFRLEVGRSLTLYVTRFLAEATK
jgi:sarcosine oxidase, subunit gamma